MTQYKFLVSCLKVLAEIPGLSSTEALRSLDAEGIDEAYYHLSTEEREAMGDLYRSAQALLVQQSNLQKDAHQLARKMAELLIRTASYHLPADAVIRGCIVHRDLRDLIGEIPPEDNQVLLMIAQWLLSQSETPSIPEANLA